MGALPACTSCAACCRGWDVIVTMEDVERLPPGMAEAAPRGYLRMKKHPSADCIALTDNRCTVYEVRPDVCRKFERGGNACSTVISNIKDAAA